MSVHLPSAGTNDQLHTYLGALFGRETGRGLIEVRYRKPGGAMRQRFYRPRALQRALPTLRVLARRHDVYLGVAPRRARHGGLDAIGHCWALWIDCDGDTSALQRFGQAPSMTVASSSGAGHQHAYWLLDQPLDANRVAVLNGRLAHALHGDPQSADAARILRPPGTHNHKHDPVTAVTLTNFTGETYDPEALAGGLCDPPPVPGLIAPAVTRPRGSNGPRTHDKAQHAQCSSASDAARCDWRSSGQVGPP